MINKYVIANVTFKGKRKGIKCCGRNKKEIHLSRVWGVNLSGVVKGEKEPTI